MIHDDDGNTRILFIPGALFISDKRIIFAGIRNVNGGEETNIEGVPDSHRSSLHVLFRIGSSSGSHIR